MLPSQQLRDTLQSLNLKPLHSSTQTCADGRNGQRQVGRMTDGKGETWSPSEMSQVKNRSVHDSHLCHGPRGAARQVYVRDAWLLIDCCPPVLPTGPAHIGKEAISLLYILETRIILGDSPKHHIVLPGINWTHEKLMLCQPFTKTDLSKHYFRYSAPAVCNSLPTTKNGTRKPINNSLQIQA